MQVVLENYQNVAKNVFYVKYWFGLSSCDWEK